MLNLLEAWFLAVICCLSHHHRQADANPAMLLGGTGFMEGNMISAKLSNKKITLYSQFL